jgi:hypothetical protein
VAIGGATGACEFSFGKTSSNFTNSSDNQNSQPSCLPIFAEIGAIEATLMLFFSALAIFECYLERRVNNKTTIFNGDQPSNFNNDSLGRIAITNEVTTTTSEKPEPRENQGEKFKTPMSAP